MRSKGSASALEAVRRRAVRMVLDGQTQAAVAIALGVHGVTVAKWMAKHRAEGEAGLVAQPTPGRPRFLTAEQEQQVRQWLAQKPTAHGFPTDLWTARRVAELIQRRFGIAFHPNYLRAWLAQRGYSPQRPTRRPRQRNDAAIAGWVANDWPRIQKKRGTPGLTSF
ncbi:MAG: IS630 family transposase [Gemmataceae bacterium]